MTAAMRPNAFEKIEIESLKLTDEEIARTYDIQSLSNEDKEKIRETVFELSKLLFLINESINENESYE